MIGKSSHHFVFVALRKGGSVGDQDGVIADSRRRFEWKAARSDDTTTNSVAKLLEKKGGCRVEKQCDSC